MAPSYSSASNCSVCDTPACHQLASAILKNLAPSKANIDPCTDFDKFACAGFASRSEIPPGQLMTSTFTSTADYDYSVLSTILEGSYTARDSPGWVSINFTKPQFDADEENFNKAQTAYKACMDYDAVVKAGVEPLMTLIHEINDIFPLQNDSHQLNSTRDLGKAILYYEQMQIPTFSEAVIVRNDIDPEYFIPEIIPAQALSLPALGLYADKTTLAAYEPVLSQVLKSVFPSHISEQKADVLAKSIIKLEVDLYSLISTNGQVQPSPNEPYYRSTIAAANKMVPRLNVPYLIDQLTPKDFDNDTIILAPPKYFSELSSLLAETTDETVHAFLIWRLVGVFASTVNSTETNPWREFVLKTAGVTQLPPRSRTCAVAVDNSIDAGAAQYPIGLGWILSRFFLEEVYSQHGQDVANKMIENILETFHSRIDKKSWLTNKVKKLVNDKLSAINALVGWPTEDPTVLDPVAVKDYYQGFHISDSHFNNTVATMRGWVAHGWNRLSNPAEDYWIFTASVNDAYYTSDFNDIVIPAGIQKSVLFNDTLPGYSQFGFLGTILSHELTHGFDSNGRHSDLHGVHTNWWDDSSIEGFDNRTACFVSQYSDYQVEYPLGSGKQRNVSGAQTLPENIADSGGINISFETYLTMRSKGEFGNEDGEEEERLPGLEKFTNEQMFYIIWAQNWCAKETDASLLSTLLADVHSPNNIRIKGPTDNSQGFREAFDCPVKEPSCSLW